MNFHGVAKDNPVYRSAPSALLSGVIIIGLALVVAGVSLLIDQTQLSPNPVMDLAHPDPIGQLRSNPYTLSQARVHPHESWSEALPTRKSR